MTTRRSYLVEGSSLDPIRSALEAELGQTFRPVPPTVAVAWDSFDGRLARAGHQLWVEESPAPVLVWTRPGDEPSARRPLERPLAFGPDLPAGPWRDALAPRLDVRRLLPRVRVARLEEELELRDAEDKVVARVRLRRRRAGAPQESAATRWLRTLVEVESIRGYGEGGRVERLLAGDLHLREHAGDDLADAAAELGLTLDRDPSKVRVELAEDEPAGAALGRVLRAQLAVMAANRDGARQDLDPEFLHDLRVAVRRTRSMLGSCRDAYPGEAREHLADELRWLGGLSGPTRDLDVLLLRLPDYEEELRDEARADFAPVAARLREERARTQAVLAEGLGTVRVDALARAWERLADSGGSGEEAARPALEFASRRIARRYRRMRRRGADLGRRLSAPEAHATTAELHALRIQGKKLRYLLEAFRSLYAKRVVSGAISTLKRFQDNLGDLNDFQVHEDLVRGAATALVECGSAPPAALVAAGRLAECLERRRAAQRDRTAELLASFTSRSTRDLYRDLVGGRREAAE